MEEETAMQTIKDNRKKQRRIREQTVRMHHKATEEVNQVNQVN